MPTGFARTFLFGIAMTAAPVYAAFPQNITINGRPGALPGPSYSIDAGLGTQVGGNLFYSFGRFGLSQSESATFTGNGSTRVVRNVIGAVTGGRLSLIDGTLRSTIAGASIYLINPAGVVFGPHATVNVSGSFYASTADYVKMADGSSFQATHPDGSTFSAAAPTAFGFLSASPSKIVVNGGSLTATAGKLGLVGGPVSLVKGAGMTVAGGTVQLTSVAAVGEAPVHPRDTAALTVTNFGSTKISGGSTLEVGAAGSASGNAGRIFVHSGNLRVSNSNLLAGNVAGRSGGIAITADGRVDVAESANISADTTGAGRAGTVMIQALNLRANGGSELSADALKGSSGDGGKIAVSATGRLVLGEGGTSGNTFANIAADSLGSGKGGTVKIAAADLVVRGGSTIGSSPRGSIGSEIIGTGGVSGNIRIEAGHLAIGGSYAPSTIAADATEGTANAGNVSVVARDISITKNGTISGATWTSGQAGRVSVTARGALRIDGTGEISATAIESDTHSTDGGNAGPVTVWAGELNLTHDGFIASATFGSANGGPVSVHVKGALTIDGTGQAALTAISSSVQAGASGTASAGSVNVSARALSIFNGGRISSSTRGQGNAGDIQVNVGDLIISDPAGTSDTGINSKSFLGTGNAGEIAISADRVLLEKGGLISTSAMEFGNAGSISITAPAGEVAIQSGAQVTSATAGPGTAGLINVSAGSLQMTDGGLISTSATGDGNAGSIFVVAPFGQVAIGSGSQVASKTTGKGMPGLIKLSAGSLQITDGGTISTAGAINNGGNIELQVGNVLYMQHGEITTSSEGVASNGGNITVDPRFVILADRSVIQANAFGGNGGNILITAGVFIKSWDSQVTASSRTGIAGTITISGEQTELNRNLIVLPAALRNPAAILGTSCASRGAQPRSSFVEGGRGGLPEDPEVVLSSLYFVPHTATSAGSRRQPIGAATPFSTGLRLDRGCGAAEYE